MSRILTIEETAQQLRVSESTVRRAVAAGSLPSFRFSENGRLLFEETALVKWLRKAQRQSAGKRQRHIKPAIA